MCKARVGTLKMATLSARKALPAHYQDVASSALSPSVDFCRHMYSCECYDYANGHICKHVHAVHMQIKADTTTCVQEHHEEAMDDLTLITPAL